MLKIKDNVDLKELEKFGFIKDIHHDLFIRYEYKPDNGVCLYVDEYKNISVFPTYYDYLNTKIMDKLFDLIKADLVEKVGEIDVED